jgi:hypothetical protein
MAFPDIINGKAFHTAKFDKLRSTRQPSNNEKNFYLTDNQQGHVKAVELLAGKCDFLLLEAIMRNGCVVVGAP